MCGIALFLAGVRIIRAAAASSIDGATAASSIDGATAASTDGATADAGEGCPALQMDDIKASLLRRGPDNLCSRKLFLHVNWANSVEKDSDFCVQHESRVLLDDEEGKENDESLCFDENVKNCIITSQDVSSIRNKAAAELDLVGATLQLRGRTPISQPLVDVSGNVLVYNGEIFGGIHVAQDSNDAETLLYALEGCCSCDYLQLGTACSCIHHGEKSVPHTLSSIRGPWALIYWQERSKTIWFGRDAYGRRSLLVHWPTINDPRFILSSVSPSTFGSKSEYTHLAQKVLITLTQSVMRRTTLGRTFQTILRQSKEMEPAPVALLFSGGLDSMILAAISDRCLDPNYTIDLLNVSFDGHLAPDRISARVGIRELQRVAPQRRWRLVEIDANLSSLTWETMHLRSLIHPAKTYMDLNIGLALWLAAGGDGWVDGEICDHPPLDCGRYKYKSTARILLVGSGADEQCAGYGRHRTKYRVGSWVALQEEMRLDMQRMWIRNLGRDDRCISDHGKEARFPFLDEDVIRTLLEFPLWEIAELDEPTGSGDKKILREVARLLGLQGAAILPKRAIQFGSRIARQSNVKNFGSNRAANQASAGSVQIHS